ncbi:MAG TPA: two-component regulator propeller domain-containing protein [Acidobacteriaceae bacterium]|nr:two-component regulator propeller domain-containing protein [Acidobacteriaceae bacterium]
MTRSRWASQFAGFLRAVALTAVALIFVCPAHALDPDKAITQYVQTAWNSASGLPENSVHAIAQTRDGYVWLGTEEGLTRFDGVRFVTYTFHNSPGLASDYIGVLAADRDGSLWAGTDSGLTHVRSDGPARADMKFESYTASQGLSGDDVMALCQDRDGAMWVGTTQGLDRIVDGRLEHWTTGHGLPDSSVTALAMDAQGTLWVGTSKGLARLDHGRFITLTAADGLPDNNITALAAGHDGSIWVGTLSGGIAQIRQGRITVPQMNWPSRDIQALLVDHDGGLWISFDHHGIGRFALDKLALYDATRGLPSDLTTRALFEDREGSFWVGLVDAGVVQLRDGKFSIFGKGEGLSTNYIGNVIQAQDGSMYFGADNYGVDHRLANGRIETLGPRQGLPNQSEYSLLVARDGSLWIGYRRGTLARYDRGHVSVYHDPQAADASMNSLFEDREGHIWVGFNSRGLAQFDEGVFRHITTSGIIRCLAQSRDGALWIATDGDGVERYQNGVMTRYTTADGLPTDHSMYVYADPEGSIWVGLASGGISRIRDGHVVSWTPSQGVPDTAVGSILEDSDGYLWMGGNNGIFRIAKQELNSTAGVRGATIHAVVYGQPDGLRVAETLFGSMPCAWKDRSGRLWFATLAGAAMVDPAHMPVNRVPPPILIERAAVNNHNVPLEGDARLGPSPVNLEVAFTSPSFIAPQLMRFRYRLEGFDPDWIEADARSARYTNLPAGYYKFRVQAESAEGVWSDPGATFAFDLRPPLSETALAYVFYIVGATLLVWIIMWYRTRSLTRRHRELERLVAVRTRQLEEEKTALEAARRELQVQATHDSLTGLFNHASILEHLEREVARAVRDGEPLGVLLADLDNFKAINDNYGHLCGDDALRETADRLSMAVRGYDLVGRYGGEEFLILFPGWDFQQAPSRVDDVLNAVRGVPFDIEDRRITITCSVGVAMFRPDVDEPSTREILSRADTALYVAKNSGRNTASFEVRPGV